MPHPRRCLGVQAIRIVVFVAAIACSAGAAPGQRPNVLFLVVDDLRPELGCYGNPIVKSPNIDRLAQRGVAFTRAYCQQAVCSPSRTSVMTGARPDTTRVWDLVTHFRAAMPDVVTVGQLFRQNGYFVQGTGKIYHGGYDDAPTWSTPWLTPKAPPYALTENLALHERQYATDPNGEKSGRKARRKAAATGDQAADAAAGAPASRRNSRGPAFEGADVPDDTFQDGKVADFAIDRLRAFQKQEQPFFLAVGFVKPHLPFVSPKKYWDLYDPASIPLATNRFRPRGAPDYAILPGSEMRSYHGIPEGSIPDDLARQLKHGYYAAISYTDAQIGRVLDELDRLGIADNTIVVLWGDHGWKLGEHDAWCKHSNRERYERAFDHRRAPDTRRRSAFPLLGGVRRYLPDARRPGRAADPRPRRGRQPASAAGQSRPPVEVGRLLPISAKPEGGSHHGLLDAHRTAPAHGLGRSRCARADQVHRTLRSREGSPGKRQSRRATRTPGAARKTVGRVASRLERRAA
jgi:arylsulfatase A-like enzyme